MLHVRIRAGGRPRGRFLPRQVQEFKERAIDRNFRVSGIDGKRDRRRYSGTRIERDEKGDIL